MVESDEQPSRDGGGAAMAALHQCELIQNMIEISISSLQGLRTKCAASNDLTQQEIRTLEVTSCSRSGVLHFEADKSNCGVMKAEGCRARVSEISLVSRCTLKDCGFVLWHSFSLQLQGGYISVTPFFRRKHLPGAPPIVVHCSA